MIRNSSDSGHEVSAEGRRSPDDRISRRPKGGGITSLRGESEMRKRKLMFTLLAAATLMVNTSVWAGSDSEIENYTRNADYESEPDDSKSAKEIGRYCMNRIKPFFTITVLLLAVFSLYVSASGEIIEKESDDVGAFNFETKTVLLNSGYEMPILGLGTYSLDYDTCVNSVKTLLGNGGRLIDTAYMYGNEDAVGEGVRQAMDEYDIPREEIFVITKIYPSQFSDPESAIEMALQKLDIGYIDMMLLHHPGEGDAEAYKAMEAYVEKGLIHSIGLSNWYVEELTDFLPQVSITPALVQNEIHPFYQEKDVVPFIQNRGIVVQCWYPLGGRGYTAELLDNETITAIAAAHNVSSAQVILRWDLQRGIVVIPGSANPEHIKENLDLFGFELTDDEMEQIAALDRGEKHDWY